MVTDVGSIAVQAAAAVTVAAVVTGEAATLLPVAMPRAVSLRVVAVAVVVVLWAPPAVAVVAVVLEQSRVLQPWQAGATLWVVEGAAVEVRLLAATVGAIQGWFSCPGGQ